MNFRSLFRPRSTPAEGWWPSVGVLEVSVPGADFKAAAVAFADGASLLDLQKQFGVAPRDFGEYTRREFGPRIDILNRRAHHRDFLNVCRRAIRAQIRETEGEPVRWELV